MNDKAKITSIQLAFLASCSALMFPYTFMPILKAPPANQDAWIVALLAMIYIVIINLPMLTLAKKFRGLDIVDTNSVILGKVGGKIVSGIYMLFAMFCFIACLLLMSIFMKTYILSETPIWAILAIMLIPVGYGIYKGAGVIARAATIIVPLILITIVFFFLLGLTEMRASQVLPVLADSTLFDINKGALISAFRFSEILIIYMFSYHLMERYSIEKSYILTLAIFFISFMIMLFGVLFLVGADIAKLTHSPFFFFSRQVGGEEIVQRVQAFNVISWLCGTLIKLVIYGYIATYILSKLIGKKSHKVYVIPLVAVTFIVANIPYFGKMSTINVLRSDEYFPLVVFFIVFVVTLIPLIVYVARRKTLNKKIQDKIKENQNTGERTIII